MSKSIKTSYGPHHKLETFFTGSNIQFDQGGDHFFCAHGPVINKVSIVDGQVVERIGNNNNEEDTIVRFVVSSDDRLLIIAYASGLITKFNLDDKVIEREFKSIHSAPISVMKIDSDDYHLATGSSDGTIKIWNLKNHYCSHNLKGVNGVITCIEFFFIGETLYLAASGGDDVIHIFDLDDSKKIAKLTSHCSTITNFKISLEHKQLYSVGRDKIAIVWNLDLNDQKKFGKPVRTIPIYESVESVVIIDSSLYSDLVNVDVGDRIFLATAGEEGLIKLWDTKTGANVFTQNSRPLSTDRSPGSFCMQLCDRPNHNQLCAISLERDVFLYDLPNLNLIQQLQGHIDEIFSACWFAKDEYIALACNSNDLKVIDIQTSKCQHLKGHNDITLCVRSVPIDPYLLISSSKDCTILIWKFDAKDKTPTIILKATGHTHAVHSLGVLFGERTFFSAGEDTTLKRWTFEKMDLNEDQDITEIVTASQTIKAHDLRVDTIAISSNDQIVATGSKDKTAKLFSVANMQILATLKGHRRGVNACQFSPVDRILVTAADMNLRLWNLDDYSCIKTLQGHDCAVLNFSYLSSGQQLISIGSDGNMKLWSVKTNDCTKTIDAHSSVTWALAMTKDDSMLVTGGQDEKLIIWRDITVEEKEERLANLQKQVAQEQDFMNYINKRRWKRALKVALSIQSEKKTLSVIREILYEPEGLEELRKLLSGRDAEQLNFLVECCVTWTSTAKNSSVAHQVLRILIDQLPTEHLLKLPSLTSSMGKLRDLTEKSFHRYERLTREATFVDFFLNATRLQ